MSNAKVLPRRLSFSKLCDILVAYLNAGADKEYFGVSEIVGKSNVTLHNISRNNNFLRSWRFIEESDEESGKYKITREAAEFAYAYRIDPNGSLTREILRGLLEKDEVLTLFIERIRNENLSRENVLIELPRVIGDLRADKVGLSAFLDMITYAFQIEDTSISPKRAKSKERKIISKAFRRNGKPSPEITSPSYSPNITINLTISPEISPKKLKEYIKAMLEAYDEFNQND